MNQLRSWLYGHDISVRNRQKLDTSSSTNESGFMNEGYSQGNQQLNNAVTSKLESSSQSTLHSVLLKAIPLAPGDCLECKLVGTGVMMLSGALVMMSAVTARKQNPKLAGFNRTIYFLLCGSLFLGLEVTAFCRLFDVGPFDKFSGKSINTKQ